MSQKDDELTLGKGGAHGVGEHGADKRNKAEKARVPRLRRGGKSGRGSRSGNRNFSSLKNRAGRAAGHKQAIIKVTGYSRCAAQAKKHALYISRQGLYTMEDETGNILDGRDDVREAVSEWDLSDTYQKSTREGYHLMLGSLPPDMNREDAMSIARDFGEKNLGDYQYVFGVHQEEKHTHIHMLIKSASPTTGKQFHLSRDNTRALRESYAETATAHGFPLVAATRRENGRAHASIDAEKGNNARNRGYLSKRDRKEINEAVERMLKGPLELRDSELKEFGERERVIKQYQKDLAVVAATDRSFADKSLQNFTNGLETQIEQLKSDPIKPSREVHWMKEVLDARQRIMEGSKAPYDLALNKVTERALGDVRHFIAPSEKQKNFLKGINAPDEAFQSRRKAGEYLRLHKEGRTSEFDATRWTKEHEALFSRAAGKNVTVNDRLQGLKLHAQMSARLDAEIASSYKNRTKAIER